MEVIKSDRLLMHTNTIKSFKTSLTRFAIILPSIKPFLIYTTPKRHRWKGSRSNSSLISDPGTLESFSGILERNFDQNWNRFSFTRRPLTNHNFSCGLWVLFSPVSTIFLFPVWSVLFGLFYRGLFRIRRLLRCILETAAWVINVVT